MAVTSQTKGKVFSSPQEAGQFVRALIDGFVGSIKVTLDNKIDDLSKEIKDSYESQTLPTGAFPTSYELSEAYKVRKVKEGFDPRIGIRTKSLVNSIKPLKISSNRWFVGTRKQYKSGDKPGNNRKFRLPAYARILEFGSSEQKARPVFRPNLRAFIPRYRDEAIKNVSQNLKRIIKSYGA